MYHNEDNEGFDYDEELTEIRNEIADKTETYVKEHSDL